MKKFSRPLVLLFTFLFIFSLFSVSSSASWNPGLSSSHNLVDPDFSNWVAVDSLNFSVHEVYSGSYDSSFVDPIYPEIYKIFRLNSTLVGELPDGVPLYSAYVLDKVLMSSGSSYTFSFHLPSPSEIRHFTTYSNTDSWFASSYADGGLTIGFGVLGSDGSCEAVLDFVTITQENYLSIAGTDFVYSFVCPDYSGGNPCIFIYASKFHTSCYYFLDNSFCLVNETAASLDQNFDEVNDNIDELDDSIDSGFSSLGDRISGFFENLANKISGFFDGLADKLSGFFDDLLSGVGSWFTKLGNLILYLSWDEEPPDNPFESEDSPLTTINEFLDKIVSYLSSAADGLNSMVDSAKAGIYIFDSFIERFPFIKSICIFALVLIVVTRLIGL